MKNKGKILLTEINKDIQMNMPEMFHEELSNAILQKTSEGILEKLKQQSSVFETPDLYFSELENDIICQTTNKSIEPSFVSKWQEKYAAIKSKELFLVPDRYFDLLPAQIQLAIFKQKKNWSFTVEEFVLQYIWKPIPMLASVFCFAIIGYFILGKQNTNAPLALQPIGKVVSIQELNKNEIAEYLALQEEHTQEVTELAYKSNIKTTDVFKDNDIKVDHKTIEETISSEDIEELTLEEL